MAEGDVAEAAEAAEGRRVAKAVGEGGGRQWRCLMEAGGGGGRRRRAAPGSGRSVGRGRQPHSLRVFRGHHARLGCTGCTCSRQPHSAVVGQHGSADEPAKKSRSCENHRGIVIRMRTTQLSATLIGPNGVCETMSLKTP